MANPVFMYRSICHQADTVISAFQFDEDADGPLRRLNDRDPTRLCLLGQDGATWQTEMEIRFQNTTGTNQIVASHIYIPPGHNLENADSWRVLKGTASPPTTEALNVSSPTAGAQLRQLTSTIGTSDDFFAIEINDADRATSMVVYQIPEIFLVNQVTPIFRGVDPRWEDLILKNVREDESESGLIRVVKRGLDRRRFIYSWNALDDAVDVVLIRALLNDDGARAGFPMIPADESAPVFVRVSGHEGPVQDHPNPDGSAPTWNARVTLTEVL